VRIALSFPGFHRRGGAERVALEAARFLAGRGHEVHLYATDIDQVLATETTVHRVQVPRKPWFLTAPIFHLRCSRLLDVRDYDAVGAFGAPSPTGGLYWAQSVHPAWLKHSKQFRSAYSKARLRQRLNPAHPLLVSLERRHLRARRYRRVLALTEAVRDDLATYHGVPSDDVDVLPVGFDPSEFNVERARTTRDEERQQHGFGDQDRVVLFAANELERKGFGPLVQAIAALNDPSVRLLVAGQVSLDGYRGLIRESGLDGRVHYAGARTDIAACYGAASAIPLHRGFEHGILAMDAWRFG
jgi:UDP-glucose:(heptosyl)LPS alpha-1,3-glucosyltransferase